MPSGSDCDGDKKWKCWYASWQNFDEQWCRDYDECPSWDDGGALIKHEPSGGGGWP